MCSSCKLEMLLLSLTCSQPKVFPAFCSNVVFAYVFCSLSGVCINLFKPIESSLLVNIFCRCRGLLVPQCLAECVYLTVIVSPVPSVLKLRSRSSVVDTQQSRVCVGF